MAPTDRDFLHHGIGAEYADAIREDGVLCGGRGGYRGQIHMTTAVIKYRDPATRRLCRPNSDARSLEETRAHNARTSRIAFEYVSQRFLSLSRKKAES